MFAQRWFHRCAGDNFCVRDRRNRLSRCSGSGVQTSRSAAREYGALWRRSPQLLAASRSHYSLHVLSSGRKRVSRDRPMLGISHDHDGIGSPSGADAFSRRAAASLRLSARLSARTFLVCLARQLNNGRSRCGALSSCKDRDGRYDLDDDFIAGGIKIAGRGVGAAWRPQLDEVFGEIVRERPCAHAEWSSTRSICLPCAQGRGTSDFAAICGRSPKPVYLFEDPSSPHLMTGSHLDIGSAPAVRLDCAPLATAPGAASPSACSTSSSQASRSSSSRQSCCLWRRFISKGAGQRSSGRRAMVSRESPSPSTNFAP